MALRIGDPAPDFELPVAGDGQFVLAEQRGRWVVLVFLRYLG